MIFAVEYASFFLGSMEIWWIKIFACPEKKHSQTWRPFWHLRPRHAPRQGRGGNWVFRLGFFSPKKNDNCTLGRRVCFLVSLYIYILCIHINRYYALYKQKFFWNIHSSFSSSYCNMFFIVYEYLSVKCRDRSFFHLVPPWQHFFFPLKGEILPATRQQLGMISQRSS